MNIAQLQERLDQIPDAIASLTQAAELGRAIGFEPLLNYAQEQLQRLMI